VSTGVGWLGSPARLLSGLLVVLLLGGAVAGCAARQAVGSDQDQAKVQFLKATEHFEDKNYLEAINVFNQVRTRFPYSTYATLAELRIADSQYELAKYIEAASAYRSFVRFHPHHAERAYALFRVGECYYQQIPGDWWFLPPTYERELGTTGDALRELQGFVLAFPADQRVPEANEMIGKLQRRLAEHELYVARFYWKNAKPRGTVMRLDYLISRLPLGLLGGEVLLLKARAHHALQQPEQRDATLQRLHREYPTSPEAVTAAREFPAAVVLAPAVAPAVPAPAVPAPAAPGTLVPVAPASSPVTSVPEASISPATPPVEAPSVEAPPSAAVVDPGTAAAPTVPPSP